MSYITYQTLVDNGSTAVVKICERFDAANDRFVTAVNTSNLAFANSSLGSKVSITKIEYAVGFKDGLLKLYWDHGSTPSDIIQLGKTQSGKIQSYIANPLSVTNDARKGNINLQVYSTQANDSYTVIIYMNKEQNFESAYAPYNVPYTS